MMAMFKVGITKSVTSETRVTGHTSRWRHWTLCSGDTMADHARRNRPRIFTARRYASAVFVVVVCPPVCLTVCHKPHRAGFWHGHFRPAIPRYVVRKYGYLWKFGYFPLEIFSQTSDYRHDKSIALSTTLVVVVDGRVCWRHLYDNRRVVAVYCKSISCNPV